MISEVLGRLHELKDLCRTAGLDMLETVKKVSKKTGISLILVKR